MPRMPCAPVVDVESNPGNAGAPPSAALRPECVAWIGLGGNLGDVRRTLAEAELRLCALGSGPPRRSPLFGSAAWGPTPGPDYLNGVLALPCRLPPEALLAAMLAIETSFGRQRPASGPRYAPRPLDLDLLAYGPTVLSTPALTLPHPRLSLRRFVLLPWAALAPDFEVPGLGRTVAALLSDCPDSGRVWPSP